LKSEAVMFVMKGNLLVFLGIEGKEVLAKEGSFIYIPEGLIHGMANPSPSEEVVLVFSYGGVSNQFDGAQTIMFSDDENFPREGWDKDYQAE